MLNPNIDLTEDRMFGRKNVSSPLWKFWGCEFPWEPVTIMHSVKSENDLQGVRFEAIATGDRKERKLKQKFRDFECGKVCECCGSRLDDGFPWNKNKIFGLCSECQKHLEERVGKTKKFPWDQNLNALIKFSENST